MIRKFIKYSDVCYCIMRIPSAGGSPRQRNAVNSRRQKEFKRQYVWFQRAWNTEYHPEVPMPDIGTTEFKERFASSSFNSYREALEHEARHRVPKFCT